MFTGIIQRVGSFSYLSPKAGGYELKVDVVHGWEDLEKGESIAVNGACLTLVGFDEKSLVFDVSRETMEKTSLGRLRRGEPLNLERALRPVDRLGGHIVLGHVDGVGELAFLNREGEFYRVGVRIPQHLSKYVAVKGSIAVDGISLTVAKKEGGFVEIAVIPHTYQHTNLKGKRVGDLVNIEVDVIARYVESLMGGGSSESLYIEFLRG